MRVAGLYEAVRCNQNQQQFNPDKDVVQPYRISPELIHTYTHTLTRTLTLSNENPRKKLSMSERMKAMEANIIAVKKTIDQEIEKNTPAIVLH